MLDHGSANIDRSEENLLTSGGTSPLSRGHLSTTALYDASNFSTSGFDLSTHSESVGLVTGGHFRERSDPSSMYSSSPRTYMGGLIVGNENSPNFQPQHSRYTMTHKIICPYMFWAVDNCSIVYSIKIYSWRIYYFWGRFVCLNATDPPSTWWGQ